SRILEVLKDLSATHSLVELYRELSQLDDFNSLEKDMIRDLSRLLHSLPIDSDDTQWRVLKNWKIYHLSILFRMIDFINFLDDESRKRVLRMEVLPLGKAVEALWMATKEKTISPILNHLKSHPQDSGPIAYCLTQKSDHFPREPEADRKEIGRIILKNTSI